MSLLGEMQADEALPKLKEALKDRDLAKQAIVSMGNLGKDGIPLLVDLMNSSPQLDIQAAAAKGLGQIGGINGDAIRGSAAAGKASRFKDRLDGPDGSCVGARQGPRQTIDPTAL